MNVEDRLFALANQIRGNRGDGALADTRGFVSQATSQAPDLFAEIKALGAAISMGTARSLQTAANRDEMVETLSRQIAEGEGVPVASARTAVLVAQRFGPIGAAPAAAAGQGAGGGWAGDSVVVGAGTPPTPPPARHPPIQAARNEGYDEDGYEEDYEDEDAPPEPWYKNKVVLGGIAGAAVLFFAFSSMQGQQQQQGAPQGGGGQPMAPGGQPMGQGGQPAAPGGQPMGPGGAPAQGGQPMGGGAQAGGSFPQLTPPGSGNMATVQLSQENGFVGVPFSIASRTHGTLRGAVVLPTGGWDNGTGGIGFWSNDADPNTAEPATFAQGPFKSMQNQQGSTRMMQPQMVQDGLQIGPMCVIFQGSGQGDVNPSGSLMCIGDGSCSQAIGCARVQ